MTLSTRGFRPGKRTVLLANLAAMAFIAVATLVPSGGDDTPTGGICLFCGSRGLADFVSNVLMFVPFGCAVALRTRSFMRVLIAGVLFSTAIEAAQFELVRGRDASVGDIVANASGAALGWALLRLRPWRAARRANIAASLALAAAIILGTSAVLRLFAPVLPPPPYLLLGMPDFSHLDQYQGKLLAANMGGIDWINPRTHVGGDATVAARFLESPIRVRFTAGPPPGSFAPIVAISHEPENEIVLLGVEQTDLLYRYWAKADAVRLSHADLRIAGVFQQFAVGDTVDMTFALRADGYCLTLNQNKYCGRASTVGDTWTALYSPPTGRRTQAVLGLVWVIFLFFPCGYVTANRGSLLVTVAASALGLVIVPHWFGVSSTPWHQIVAAGLSMMAGYVLAGRMTGARHATATASDSYTLSETR